MTRRIGIFVALAVVLAAVFVRLGFWQIDRLRQRRAANAIVAAQLAQPPVAYDAAKTGRYRRVSVRGIPDLAHEIVVTGRSRNGSPGVHIVTPIRIAGESAAVLVNRGWVYAPDASTADLSQWRETRGDYSGYVLPLVSKPVTPVIRERRVRELTVEAVRQLLPYPAVGVIVAQDSAGERTPARLPSPTLDDGPHLSYAIQWFSFAAIALGGAAAVVSRARKRDSTGATGA